VVPSEQDTGRPECFDALLKREFFSLPKIEAMIVDHVACVLVTILTDLVIHRR
jgi:hypothetical protein